ncbi:hypothetical protein Taro_036273, partial [Colocasia esculenta]|nr:hypothetical protein [Colocasia esculenta]
LVSEPGDVLEREWLSRRLVRRLEMLCHLKWYCSAATSTSDAARAWLDAVERTFRSMECVPEERVLLGSYQLQAQALTWWSSEWETTFQYRPLRQILWQEFVIMADEGLRTQQFVRGLRPELRQALIVARVTDLDAAYQTAAVLEADTLRTRARSAEVQTQQQQAPVQQRQQTRGSGGSRGRGRVTHLTRADAEAAHLVEDAYPERLVHSSLGSQKSCGHDSHSADIFLVLSSIVQTGD